MQFNFSRQACYNKRKLTQDVLMTLKSMRVQTTGKLVTELQDTVFACLQTALVMRGHVVLPGLGEIRIRIMDGQLRYFFEPSVEVVRRVRCALSVDDEV